MKKASAKPVGGAGGSPGAKSKIPKLMKGASPAASPSTPRRVLPSPASGGATIVKPVTKPMGKKAFSTTAGQESISIEGGTAIKVGTLFLRILME